MLLLLLYIYILWLFCLFLLFVAPDCYELVVVVEIRQFVEVHLSRLAIDSFVCSLLMCFEPDE